MAPVRLIAGHPTGAFIHTYTDLPRHTHTHTRKPKLYIEGKINLLLLDPNTTSNLSPNPKS